LRQKSENKILILDFGSQYTHLIARRIREQKVYCEIYPFNCPIKKIKDFNPKGVILSGGPSSVYEKNAPICDIEVFNLGIPVLGICYGLQLMCQVLGGEVQKSAKKEYGNAFITISDYSDIFKGFSTKKTKVWMSHGDKITRIPNGFSLLAVSENTPYCAIENKQKNFIGVQFHPEVEHTPRGREILKNFLFAICNCKPDWNIGDFVKSQINEIQATVGESNIICGLSGGVDSSTLAVLLHKAVGDKLKCIFVNNGLLRDGEAQKVVKIFKDNFKINLIYVDAEDRFLKALQGVIDPEQKRKIIGREFIEVFEQEANTIKNVKFLAQGTLYPDVIESVSVNGPSCTIKSHHNVGGLPDKMNLKLVEPFRELFKDEVRLIAGELSMPKEIINRQPFPGPGLAVRIIGEIDKHKLEILRKADKIIVDEVKAAGLYNKVWQSFGVLLPIKSVGVMGDERTYENVAVIRIVESSDGMTADWVKVSHNLLELISNRIINEVKGINRVVYDISSKPPSTIEWE